MSKKDIELFGFTLGKSEQLVLSVLIDIIGWLAVFGYPTAVIPVIVVLVTVSWVALLFLSE